MKEDKKIEETTVAENSEEKVPAEEAEKESALTAEEAAKVIEELKKEVATLKENDKTKEYKDKWMRSVAEFDNYKKRNANLYREAYGDGKKEILLKVLSVGDNLERALAMELDEKTKEGVSMILRSFTEMLEGQGVTEINPVGEKFDPNFCEAVMQAEAGEGEEADRVKAVFQKGYKMGEKVIRYAKVSVTK